MNFLSLLMFLPALLFDILSIIFTKQKWYNRIDDLIILGALPFSNIAAKLINEENIKAVVSLNKNYELWIANNKKEWEKANIQFLHLSTIEMYEVPSKENLKKGVEFIKEFNKLKRTIKIDDESNASIYIHCRGGRTRSATLVACYLMEKYRWDPETAVQYIKTKRPQVSLPKKHCNLLWEYYSNM